MKNNLILFVLILLSFSAISQDYFDTIVTINNKKIGCNLFSINNKTITYYYLNTSYDKQMSTIELTNVCKLITKSKYYNEKFTYYSLKYGLNCTNSDSSLIHTTTNTGLTSGYYLIKAGRIYNIASTIALFGSFSPLLGAINPDLLIVGSIVSLSCGIISVFLHYTGNNYLIKAGETTK